MTQGLKEIKSILGVKNYVDNSVDKSPYENPWRGHFPGKAALVAFPTSTKQLATLIHTCHKYQIPVVPQGGNTGLVGGSTPDESGKEIVVNMSRMNAIRNIDPINFTVTVEAGCILSVLKEKLEAEKLLFPLSMASEGSAEVGGIIATNAGGTAVLRYGNVRALVLGLEAVMPDGNILNSLKGLRKDNAGYDIKQLLIGSEGTLGIITAATLKLFPLPIKKETALLAISELPHALELLSLFRTDCDDKLTAFELIPAFGMELVEKHIKKYKNPLSTSSPYTILAELSTANAEEDVRGLLERTLEKAFEHKLITDGVIAENETQRHGLWGLRENITEAEKQEGAMINFDISVPVSRIADFIHDAIALCQTVEPDLRPVPFGHIGDGNVHFNLLQPADTAGENFLKKKSRIKKKVYDITNFFYGSISAEHGIGRERKYELSFYKSSTEMELMRSLKRALDPENIMNPGRVIDV